MSLNKTVLKQNLKQLAEDMLTRETNSTDEWADRMANMIEAFVKSGTVTVAVGIPVSTTGTALAQTGATTGTGTGTIN